MRARNAPNTGLVADPCRFAACHQGGLTMRKLALALAIGLLASASGLGGAVQGAAAAADSGAKVVIVVGATGSMTASFRADGDAAAATFSKYTSNIVKVYSPNATWAAVQAAAQGASVLVYIGHGSGYPNPYVGYLQPNGDNGMGLNSTAGSGDSNTKYYGENYMAQLNLATNAVVLLWRLCYASGDNEWGTGTPTLSVAQTRVDGYASGFLRGNARAVIAEGLGDIAPYIDAIFSTHETIDQMWKSAPNFHNHVTSWGSTRNSGYTSQIDPDYDHPQSDGDPYYRSMVSLPGLSTDSVGQVATYATGATYHTLAPARVLDSRISLGAGLFHSQTKHTVLVATTASHVPTGAVAVTGNVTIVGQTRLGYVTVAPSLTSGVPPPTSTINFPVGDTRANGITVPLAPGGKLDAMYWSASTSDTVNVIFDVTGYFSNDATGATYHTLAPARVLDSRISLGAGLFHSQTKHTVLVATTASHVPTGAVAVTGNVTIVGQTRLGYVTVAPSLTSGVPPPTSTINFPVGDTRANGITVPLAPGGKLDAMYWSASTSDTVNVIFDVTGYFS
jgi:hypothetical protein